MRLADRHGRPLSQVASEYPAWELPYWSVWMARTPSDGQRAEIAVARLHQSWLSAHQKKGQQAPPIERLLMPDYWAEHDRKVQRQRAQEDASALTQMFASAGVEVVHRKPTDEKPEYL